MWRFRSLFAALSIGITLPFWAILMLLTARFGASRQIQTSQIQAWMRFVSALYAIRYRVHYPADWGGSDRPCLVVFNHQSLFDMPAVYGAYPGDLRMLAKQELFDLPFFGAVLKRTGHVPVNQKNPESRQRSIDKLREIAREGYHVCVMPEGARSDTRWPALFRRGSFQMAIELGLDVRIICLMNTIDVCHRRTLWARPGVTVEVKVLEKISTRGYTVEQAAELAAHVRGRIVEELELRPEERLDAEPPRDALKSAI